MNLYNLYDFCSSNFFVSVLAIAVPLFFVNLLELLPRRGVATEKSTGIDKLFANRSFTFGKIVTVTLCFFLSAVVLFANNQFVIMLGCEDIRVMPDGTYCYYVLATNEKGKTYTLPAKIYTGEEYQVENIYFKNGGYLYLAGTCYIDDYEHTNSCTDQNKKEWEIGLTNRKTTHPKVKETNPFKPTRLILNFVFSAMFLICAILNIWHWSKFRKHYK